MYFGEDYAKVSRDQRRIDRARVERPFAVRIVSTILFNMPIKRAEELDLLTVDDLTYGMHWREFATDLLDGWKESSYLVRTAAAVVSISSIP